MIVALNWHGEENVLHTSDCSNLLVATVALAMLIPQVWGLFSHHDNCCFNASLLKICVCLIFTVN